MSALPLSERDEEFFDEVFCLMQSKYPEMSEKFGIWRVHQHFEINEDEVFHETTDEKTQESTLRIINKKDLPEQAFATTWKLTDSGPEIVAWCCDWVKTVR